VPRKGNVTVLPLAMSRLRDPGTPTQSERAWLEELPRPRLLLALGGPTKYWDLDPEQIAGHTRKLVERARRQRGTVIAVSSRRTPPPVVEAVRAQLGTDDRIVDGVGPRFSLLMSDADEIFVTADSVSMLSEAIQTSKPVGMVPISLSSKGRRMIGKDGGSPSGRRDLRRIWEALAENGLVGTVEEPAAGDGQIVALDLAVAAVRRALQEQAA
jgi:hypothetical protein